MTQFHVGQKVVCVDEVFTVSGITDRMRAFVDWIKGYSGPEINHVYEVYDLSHHQDGLYLSIIGFDRWVYHASAFRPLIKRKTDISVFKAMLNPQKTEVTA